MRKTSRIQKCPHLERNPTIPLIAALKGAPLKEPENPLYSSPERVRHKAVSDFAGL